MQDERRTHFIKAKTGRGSVNITSPVTRFVSIVKRKAAPCSLLFWTIYTNGAKEDLTSLMTQDLEDYVSIMTP